VDGKPSLPIKNIRTRKEFVGTTTNVPYWKIRWFLWCKWEELCRLAGRLFAMMIISICEHFSQCHFDSFLDLCESSLFWERSVSVSSKTHNQWEFCPWRVVVVSGSEIEWGVKGRFLIILLTQNDNDNYLNDQIKFGSRLKPAPLISFGRVSVIWFIWLNKMSPSPAWQSFWWNEVSTSFLTYESSLITQFDFDFTLSARFISHFTFAPLFDNSLAAFLIERRDGYCGIQSHWIPQHGSRSVYFGTWSYPRLNDEFFLHANPFKAI
jgi:hypothetical protein